MGIDWENIFGEDADLADAYECAASDVRNADAEKHWDWEYENWDWSDGPDEDEFFDEDDIDEYTVILSDCEYEDLLLEQKVVYACARQFKTMGLRLYMPGGKQQGSWLIGDGKGQLFGVMPSVDGKTYRTGTSKDGMPVLYYSTDDIEQDRLGVLFDQIGTYLCSWEENRMDREDTFCPVPMELHARLAQARLIQPRPESYLWEPTPLGVWYGLSHGFVLLDSLRTCHTFFIHKASLSALKDLLTKEQVDCSTRTSWLVLSMEERLNRMAEGLPGNDIYALKLMKKLGDMPLEKYMGQCPDDLKQFRKKLPGEPVSTVQEAAARISEIWHTPGCNMEKCKDLIYFLLVVPMVNDLVQFQKIEGGT